MKDMLRFASEDRNLDQKLRDMSNNKGVIYNTLGAIKTLKKRINGFDTP